MAKTAAIIVNTNNVVKLPLYHHVSSLTHRLLLQRPSGNKTRDILTNQTKTTIKKCHRNITWWLTPASLFFPFCKKPLTQRPSWTGSETCLPLPCLVPYNKPLFHCKLSLLRVWLSVHWVHKPIARLHPLSRINTYSTHGLWRISLNSF